MKIENSEVLKKVENNRNSTRYPFGFNVCGFLSKDFGLGFAARNTVKLLLENNFPVSVFDIPIAGYSGPETDLYDSLKSDLSNPFPYLITIFHVNPPILPQILPFYEASSDSHINLIVPFWELEKAPVSWFKHCSFIDFFLAPTRFIEKSLLSLFSNSRVLYYQQPYKLPSIIKSDRKRFSIPEEKIVFFQSFDIASDIVRKNPVLTINAFIRAFQENSDAMLILNVNVTNNTDAFIRIISNLKKCESQFSNVKIFDQNHDYSDALTLCASSDVLISLHRAEGLGLSLIEAMVMGKAVITTAYSGNMDFVTNENACLVPYKLIPAASPFNPGLSRESLGFDPFWAEPDIDQAARWMQMLYQDISFRNTMQHKAKESINMFLEKSQKAEVFFSLKEMLNN